VTVPETHGLRPASPRTILGAHGTVTTVEGLHGAAADVEHALVRRGLTLGSPVVVRLRSRSALTRAGLITDPHTVGVCRARWTSRHRVEAIDIALVAGLSAVQARAVLAHEYAHALMFDRMVLDLPPLLAEGFAEFICHTYLTYDHGGPEALALADAMHASKDPLYGAGLRLIGSHVRTLGFAAVWTALTRGDSTAHQRLLTVNPTDARAPSLPARAVAALTRSRGARPDRTPNPTRRTT
jgi:hypothetical protein